MDYQGNLTSPAVVKALLREHGLRPKKRLGQNFLIDGNILDRITQAADLDPHSLVLEIGPGIGTVTRALAQKAAKIVAVEADRGMIPVLVKTLSGLDNVEAVEADFLRIPLAEFLKEHFGGTRCTVVSNLPYYITAPILTRLLDVKGQIRLAVLMVQKEVARRLAAEAGADDYGAITVLAQYHCEVEVVAQVSRNVFYPAPEVDSALIRLIPRETPAAQPKDEELFFKVSRAAFGQRRKTILNALSGSPTLGLSKARAGDALTAAGIDGTCRGETLGIAELARLADAIAAGDTGD